MAKVAIALFVKNEGTDIAGWIAWHLALGIDTLFIFDDHSSDGTWEIIQAASQSLNVRAFRTDLVAQPYFYWRQRDCYMKAAEMAKGHFDWLGYLDGDEYFYPVKYDNASDFFDRFDHADAIAISWCIYGSSDRVVRPRTTAIEAFKAHSTPELGDNGLVKSFIRPEKLGPNYTDPHRFDIPEEKYVDAKGERVVWHGATKNIDWEDAKILHYICRSMEHYTQRIRRRLNADLGDSQAYWNHFNRNDIIDEKPLRFLPKMNTFLCTIYRNNIGKAIDVLSDFLQIPSKEDSLPLNHSRTNDAVTTKVYSFFDTFLCMDKTTGELIFVSEEYYNQSGNLAHVNAVIYQSSPNYVTLYLQEEKVVNMDRPIYAYEDGRISSELVYRIVKNENTEKVYLQNPVTQNYLSAVPVAEDNAKSRLECNRNQPSWWEEMSLVLEHDVPYIKENIPFPDLPAEGLSVGDLCRWLIAAPEKPNTSEFMRAVYEMSVSEKDKLKNIVPNLLFTLF